MLPIFVTAALTRFTLPNPGCLRYVPIEVILVYTPQAICQAFDSNLPFQSHRAMPLSPPKAKHARDVPSLRNRPSPSPSHLEVLKRVFGHNQFREHQWEIIEALMVGKKDVCAVMATGEWNGIYSHGSRHWTGSMSSVFCLMLL